MNAPIPAATHSVVVNPDLWSSRNAKKLGKCGTMSHFIPTRPSAVVTIINDADLGTVAVRVHESAKVEFSVAT